MAHDRSIGTERSDDEVDVVVVGAGLAGLTAAVTAAEGGASVRVVESGRPGGRARTTTVDPGVVLNGGPRALYVGGHAARVLTDLGVRWRGTAPGTRGSRALLGDQVHTLPGTARQLLRTGLLGPRSKVRVGWLLATIARQDPTDLVGRTVSEWLRGLGLADDAADLLLAVLRLATYVDRPRELDAGAAVGQLQLALGSGVVYVDSGWQTLVDQLLERARTAGVVVDDHAAAVELGRGRGAQDDRWSVGSGGRRVLARSVVLAVGSPSAAAALSPVPLDLGGIGEPVTAACLELAVRGVPRTPFLLGIDRPLYLSQHGPPARLAPGGTSVVHVLRYGATEAAADRAELWAHAAAAGIDRGDVTADRFLRRMVVSGGVPLAATGGLAGRPAVSVPGTDDLFLAGDWVGADGLLADAAVASGRRAGQLAGRVAGTAPVSPARTG